MYNLFRSLSVSLFLPWMILGLTGPYDLSAQPILREYITYGLQNNATVKEKKLSLEQNELSFEQAKTHLLPTVDLEGTYTLATGGRTIDIPAGDLLNGVYNTLNELTGTQRFPQLQNVSEPFNPNNFLDARFQISYPLLDPSVRIGRDISQKIITLSDRELDIYKADLTRNIKLAYYQYSTAYLSLRVYEDAEILLNQHLSDNRSLVKNGKGLPAHIIRAESELSALQAEKIRAENQLANARLQLNFLLNRNPETEIIYQPITEKQIFGYDSVVQQAPVDVYELQHMDQAIEIQKSRIESFATYSTPRIHAFARLGVQTFDLQFDNQSPYLLAGLQLTLPIYHNGRNKMEVQQQTLRLHSLQNQKEILKKDLNRKIQTALLRIKSSESSHDAAKKHLHSAQKYFDLVNRSYRSGTTPLIDFLDARRQLTEAELQLNLSAYGLLIAGADYERILASETHNINK